MALLKLERKGVIRLPPAREFAGANKRTRAPKARRMADRPWNGKLDKLQPIQLILIGGAGSRASQQWNELMSRHHYLGAGPLCGAQLRYLVHSPHYGYLGALAFSAAAWRLEARDQWIGWSEPARGQNLSRVIANSRFLIVPYVKAPNLASHVLGIAMRRIRADWKDRYGEDLLLVETFVEKQRFRGTCYQAWDWITAGETKGRGRQDWDNQPSYRSKGCCSMPWSGRPGNGCVNAPRWPRLKSGRRQAIGPKKNLGKLGLEIKG